MVNFCDYFVICTGSSERHLRAVTDGVEQGLAAKGIKVNFSKGLRGLPTNPDDANGAWVLLDMGDVIIHVFDAQAREFYGLEHLWQAAPKVEFKSH